MNRPLFWKLCLIIATGVVAMFYILNFVTTRTEEGMSFIAQSDRDELSIWKDQVESLYIANNIPALENWLKEKQEQESTWMTVANFELEYIAGNTLHTEEYSGYNLGRNIDWNIHLYIEENPVMELPFSSRPTSLLVLLPERMRPGSNLQSMRIILQVILPMTLLAALSVLLYRHIMQPLRKLERATRDFSQGDFSVRAKKLLGNRNDEISELADTFDQMAERIGEQIVNQRQLISDLSHELRTPLTRLDIALDSALSQCHTQENLTRVSRESKNIRRLVEDSLTLAWLENEQPGLENEELDLVDLIDVIVEDAHFEFPNSNIVSDIPETAILKNSNHRAVGQALENTLRNALRFTPAGKQVHISLKQRELNYLIQIQDQGPGVPEQHLETIFLPFFRIDKSREADTSSFGLGLALSRRQINAVGGSIEASNIISGGLLISITLQIE